jgi:protoheme IX farnesyltransferase
MSMYPGTQSNAGVIEQSQSALSVFAREAIAARLTDYVRLCRPRIAVMTSVSVAAGFALAATTAVDWSVMLAAVAGVVAFVAASSVLNQTLERDTDALMQRTMHRPLVTGSVSVHEGWLLGLGFAAIGSAILFFAVNSATAIASMLTMLVYVFAYTPAKRRTTLCTTIGAVPGAMPPVLGWLACRGDAGIEALSLFAIFFVWQFPHFLAIGWIYRGDYRDAGLRMLPSFTDNGRSTAILATAYAAVFVPVCCLPRFVGLAGTGYLFAALLLSLGYLAFTIRFALNRTDVNARRLMASSLICLPCLLLCLVFDYIRLTS